MRRLTGNGHENSKTENYHTHNDDVTIILPLSEMDMTEIYHTPDRMYQSSFLHHANQQCSLVVVVHVSRDEEGSVGGGDHVVQSITGNQW